MARHRALYVCSFLAILAPLQAQTITYSEHIAPLLYNNCTKCHRPGQVAPFSLLTYDDALRHGRDIGFLARRDGSYCGLALCFTDEEDSARGQIISMWVAPEVRRQQVGRQLIEMIATWGWLMIAAVSTRHKVQCFMASPSERPSASRSPRGSIRRRSLPSNQPPD